MTDHRRLRELCADERAVEALRECVRFYVYHWYEAAGGGEATPRPDSPVWQLACSAPSVLQLLDDLDRQQCDLDAARADLANTNRLYVDELANAERLRADVERLTNRLVMADVATANARERVTALEADRAQLAARNAKLEAVAAAAREWRAAMRHHWYASDEVPGRLREAVDAADKSRRCTCQFEAGDNSICAVHPNHDDTADKEPHE